MLDAKDISRNLPKHCLPPALSGRQRGGDGGRLGN